jgi:hypothetical protein
MGFAFAGDSTITSRPRAAGAAASAFAVFAVDLVVFVVPVPLSFVGILFL